MLSNKFTGKGTLPRDIRLIPSKNNRSFNEMAEIINVLGHPLADGTKSQTQSIDIQVTERCNLCCTYCFQQNKSGAVLKLEDAKKFFDYVLTRTPENCMYTNPDRYHGVVLGFVGGDALLEADLIDDILTYFVEKMLELGHPWLNKWAAHLDTNGVLYYSDSVQRLLKKWPNTLSCTITLDGNEELHDKCRIFPDGSGSYKYALAAIDDQFKKGLEPSGKFTVSHENIDYLYDAILNMLDVGYTFLLGNEVYEDVWTEDDPRKYYDQLCRIGQYFLDNELYESVNFPIMEIKRYIVTPEKMFKNCCGGNGEMLNLSPDGKIYNCYRYNRSSVSPRRKPLFIGDVEHGIGFTDEEKHNIKTLWSLTKPTCCDDECFFCPIGGECRYCNGCNYYETGDPGKKTKFHCLMHAAASLATAWYWNSVWKKKGMPNRWPVLCPEDKALKVLSKHEYDELVEYCKEV